MNTWVGSWGELGGVSLGVSVHVDVEMGAEAGCGGLLPTLLLRLAMRDLCWGVVGVLD